MARRSRFRAADCGGPDGGGAGAMPVMKGDRESCATEAHAVINIIVRVYIKYAYI